MRATAVLLASALAGCSAKPRAAAAVLKTSMGDIRVRLYAESAPQTVENFIALAQGGKEWTDPRDGRRKKTPLYERLTFHRVIPGFMIQTGDPAGDGSGDVGFTIPDEISPARKFDRPGMVGMANLGPNTGASQFFITLSPQPDLNGRHALFGEVVSGLEVARRIAAAPRDESEGRDRPLKPVYLESIVIE